LAAAGISNSGSSVLNLLIGSFPTTSITGFPPGSAVQDNTDAPGAIQDASAMYGSLVAGSFTSLSASSANLSVLGNGATAATYNAGSYSAGSSMDIPSAITLDGQGNPNATFIFKAGSTLTLESNISILLVNGAQSKNIYWLVGSNATTVGTAGVFQGNILANTSVTIGGGTVNGHIFAGLVAPSGAVVFSTATIVNAPSEVQPSPAGTFSVLGCVGLPNIQVQLTPVRMVTGGSTNSQLLYTISDALGNYAFQGVAPGQYQISAVDSTGVHIYRNRVAATVVNADLTDLNPVPALANALYGSSRTANVANSPLS
jgi:hypothetical protein